MYILKIEIDIITNSITIAGTETPLNITFITLQDKRESIYSELSRQNTSTILLLNKSKKLQA